MNRRYSKKKQNNVYLVGMYRNYTIEIIPKYQAQPIDISKVKAIKLLF
jgi:hypothetical protein